MKKVLIFLLSTGIVFMLIGLGVFFWMVKDAPELDEKLLKDPIASSLLDANGNEFAQIGQSQRIYTKYKDIPPVLEKAVLSTEDARFYDHYGVDFIRFGGAVIANIQDGGYSQGGSTITQQVVKYSFLTFDKTLTRKFQEMWLAIQLERKYTKQEILELYLNKIFYGARSYGVAKAAETYFGVTDLKDLTLEQAALLAGIPQRPNAFNPFTNPKAAEERRNLVLKLMVKNEAITQAEADQAAATPIEKTLIAEKDRNQSTGSETVTAYESFIDEVIEEITTKQPNLNVFTDGLKIYTTMDKNAQQYVDELLDGNDIDYPNDDFQAGVVLMDTKTGEVRAIGGGRNQTALRGFNYATDIKRQPGSTIKPLLDYGPAVEYLNWSSAQMLKDAPYSYSNGTPIHNWDRSYDGTITMRKALARSRNIPALKAMQEVGLDKAKDFGNKLGLGLDDIYESYSIGGLKKGVSPMKMAGAYAAFGNGGTYHKPYTVAKVILQDGSEINFRSKPNVVMKDSTAYIVTDMLKSVVDSGTGTTANIPYLNVAGKTGTTNFDEETSRKYGFPSSAVPDSWFVGYTPQLTASVWTGYSKNGPNNYMTGYQQKIAQQIFRKVVSVSAEKLKNTDFEKPDSVVELPIIRGSNPPAIGSKNGNVTYELFVRGAEPNGNSEPTEETVSAVDSLSAIYNEANEAIDLSWNFNNPDNKDVEFEIQQSVDDGGFMLIGKTTSPSYTISNALPGAIYKFQVVAIIDGTKGSPVTTTVEIPSNEIEEPTIEEPEEPTTEEPTDETVTEPDDGSETDIDTPEEPTTPTTPVSPNGNSTNTNNGGLTPSRP